MTRKLLLLGVVLAIAVALFFGYQHMTPTDNPQETPQADDVQDDFFDSLPSAVESGMELSFAHVVPGEYSEVYVVRRGEPGEQMLTTLRGPGLIDPADNIAVADENGIARFTWKINRYGFYTTAYDVDDPGDMSAEMEISDTIEVK